MDKELAQKMINIARENFKGQESLVDFLRFTMNNFCYRYLETSTDSNIEVSFLDERTLGAMSKEINMVEALKVSHPGIKKTLIEFAKQAAINKTEVFVSYLFSCEIASEDKIIIRTAVDWSASSEPFKNKDTYFQYKKIFKYDDVMVLRNTFVLALEEACEIFI